MAKNNLSSIMHGSSPRRIKIAIACLWTTLKQDSQIVSNSPGRSFSQKLKSFNKQTDNTLFFFQLTNEAKAEEPPPTPVKDQNCSGMSPDHPQG